MNNVAVLNCSHIINFGSVLQSYAIEKVVRDLTGAEVYSIRYRQKKDIIYIKNYLHLLLNKEVVLFKFKGIKRKLYLEFMNKELGGKCSKRESCFKTFTETHFNYSEVYRTKGDLKKMARDFSCVVLGSDQVWHPINYGSHYYTMEWVPDHVTKISYAASFGVGNIPRNQLKGTAKYLKRINAISVREKRGAEIVEKLIGKKPSIVVDPTLLLSVKDWDNICAPIDEKEDYIFCYFLGNNRVARSYSNYIKEETGLKIISIPFMDEINNVDFNFGDKQLYNIGPAEFLSYIKKAKYVVTDSFHGTVFSLLYHRQFITFNRFETNEKASTNSRIDTLLEQVGQMNRRYGQPRCDINQFIDYMEIDDKIEALRQESLSYLQKALGL